MPYFMSWTSLVEEALDPKKEAEGATLVVQNHLSQMKMFVIRGGVELYPVQDDLRQSRKTFIDNFFRVNKVAAKLDRLCDLFNAKGEVLMYFRPTQNGQYRLHFYGKDQYKAYHDKDGDLSKVVIIYSYKEESKANQALSASGNTRWLKATITAETITFEKYHSKPSFKMDSFGSIASGIGVEREVYANSLKFLPCVVCKNYTLDDGAEGMSDFFQVRSQLENLDEAVRNINKNLKFFGNSTLVTSRSKREMLQAGQGDYKARDSISSRSGYSDPLFKSSYGSNPSRASRISDDDMSVVRIFSGIGPEDRMAYISPDPISPDHALHVRELREQIHFALGGIDELGISANATAYEMKVIYGKVATTASKKAMALFTYGLCLILEQAIAAEEDLFRQSLALALGKEQPEITDGFIQELMETNGIPNEGVFGLIPIGNREIKWRYTGEVFEKSARDKMEESIVVRNLQELGMPAKEALQVTNLFENKTNAEIEAVLANGYPYRYVNSVLGSTQQMAGLYGQLLGLPDPQQNMQVPLGASLPINELIGRGLETISRELSYREKYRGVSPGDPPIYRLGLSNFQSYLDSQVQDESAVTTANSPNTAIAPTDQLPATAAGYFPGYNWPTFIQPSGGTEPTNGGTGRADYDAQLPEPGSTVRADRYWQSGAGPAMGGYESVSDGYNSSYIPAITPASDNSTNADRRTRKPVRRSTSSRSRRQK